MVKGAPLAAIGGREPLNVLGNVSGDLARATRVVLAAPTDGENGTLNLALAPEFVIINRVSLRASDTSVWTPVPRRPDELYVATQYRIESSIGAFANATGTLVNDGNTYTTTGLVTLRYEGEICLH